MYGFIIIPINILLSIRNGITPYHLICANPGIPYGGMPIASKFEILEVFKESNKYLKQLLMKGSDGSNRFKIIQSAMKNSSLTYPVIAKPDKAYVGFGLRKIDNDQELKQLISETDADYIIQEYCGYPIEFGVFYCRFPWRRRGRVLGLTRKIIPEVTGDGTSTVRALIDRDPRYFYNKQNLFKYATTLDLIPKKGETMRVIQQGSHTYGAIFQDASSQIPSEMHGWVDKLCQSAPGIYFGRFDMKFKSKQSMKTGNGVKAVELNGCTSEPTHMYDDNNSLVKGIQELWTFYSKVYKIAKAIIKSTSPKINFAEINREYREFFKMEKSVRSTVG